MMSTSKSASGASLLNKALGVKGETAGIKVEEVDAFSTPTAKPTRYSEKISSILSTIPNKGGISHLLLEKIKEELVEPVEEAICDAAEATESRMKTEYASEEASSARSSEGITRDEFLELLKAGVWEILPESYRLSGKTRQADDVDVQP